MNYGKVTPSGRSAGRRTFKTALLAGSALWLAAAPAQAQVVVAPEDGADVTLDSNIIYERLTANEGGTITGDGVTVTNDDTAIHVVRSNGGAISLINSHITGVRGGGADGTVHNDGGTINLTGGTITANPGGSSRVGNAVVASGSDSVTNIIDVDIEIDGDYGSGNPSSGVYALNGATIDLSDGTITTKGSVYAAEFVLDSHINADNMVFTTDGEFAHGLQAYAEGSARLSNTRIVTTGDSSRGVHALYGASVELFDSSIATTGEDAYGVWARSYSGVGADIVAENLIVSTDGKGAHGILVEEGSTFIGDDVNITISAGGTRANPIAGAHATAGGQIDLTGGSITTTHAVGTPTESSGESWALGLFADGADAEITIDGATITTEGQRSYGAYAINAGSIDLTGGSIETSGFMAYGIYADYGSEITADNLNITTTGGVGDAAWAVDGSTMMINGGVFHVWGEKNPNAGEVPMGLHAWGSDIYADGLTVITEGADSIGVRANSDDTFFPTIGRIWLTDSSVTVNGDNAYAALVHGRLEATGSELSALGEGGRGVWLDGDAEVILNASTVWSAEESLYARMAGDYTQSILVGDGSVITENNGTLLLVSRTEDGADGVVTLTLGAGSVTSGDILDEGAAPAADGGTDVIIQAGASWSGTAVGVRSFDYDLEDGESADLHFESGSVLAGLDLVEGVTITGGSAGNGEDPAPYVIEGDVNNNGGTFGGNVDVLGDYNGGENPAGNFSFSPGNSAGIINIAGDFNAGPGEHGLMEIDVTAPSAVAGVTHDQINIGGDLNILDGAPILIDLALLDASGTAAQAYEAGDVVIGTVGGGVFEDGTPVGLSDALVQANYLAVGPYSYVLDFDDGAGEAYVVSQIAEEFTGAAAGFEAIAQANVAMLGTMAQRRGGHFGPNPGASGRGLRAAPMRARARSATITIWSSVRPASISSPPKPCAAASWPAMAAAM